MGGPLTAHALQFPLTLFPNLPFCMAVLTLTDRGFYCEPGDFYIDPWEPVDRAVITHAHGDHASWGTQTQSPRVSLTPASSSIDDCAVNELFPRLAP